MIGSPEVNKVIRQLVSPVLRDYGFQHVSTRNNWHYAKDAISVLNIRSVGSYFSDVTGWPPQSLVCHVGLYFPFIPSLAPMPHDKKTGNLIPHEASCHLRLGINARIDQTTLIAHLSNPAERQRSDIWWIDPLGSNVIEAVSDLSKAIEEQALPFFLNLSSPEVALQSIRDERDCYNKFYRGYYIARHLHAPDSEHFYRLAQAEALRIGRAFPINE